MVRRDNAELSEALQGPLRVAGARHHSDEAQSDQYSDRGIALINADQEGSIGTSTPANELWDGSNGLQPAELLNKKAKTGKFSLQTVLSTSSDVEDAAAESPNPDSADPEHRYALDDPIRSNLLNFPTALGLYDR